MTRAMVLTVAALWPFAALAQTIPPGGDLAVSKVASKPPPASNTLRVTTTGVLIDCGWKAGQVIMQLGNEGGTGGAVTYSLAAPSGGVLSGDLAVGGAPPACSTANSCLVIGPNGVGSANCGKIENVVINVAPAARQSPAELQRFGSPDRMTPVPRPAPHQ